MHPSVSVVVLRMRLQRHQHLHPYAKAHGREALQLPDLQQAVSHQEPAAPARIHAHRRQAAHVRRVWKGLCQHVQPTRTRTHPYGREDAQVQYMR